MNSRELDFKIIEKDKINDVVELMEEVNDNIKDKSIFSKDEKHELVDLIDRGGSIIGVYHGDKLVAFRTIKVPSKEDNLAYDIKNFHIDPKTVIINDSVAVLKEYRGMNLQNITRDKIGEIYENTKFTNKMSTISPTNPRSYKNALESGYTIIALKKKYPDEKNPEGYDRFILLKSNDIKFKFTTEEKIIHYDNIGEIKKVLCDNYFGVSVDNKGNIKFKEVKII